MTQQRPSIVVGVRNPQLRADLAVAASGCALARSVQSPLVLVHVITPSEVRRAEADTRLERVDERILEQRRQLWRMARALTGAGSPRFRVSIDVRVADSAHQGLCDAAEQHAASSIFVGPGVSTVAALTEMAPCNVVVARPKTTPDEASSLIEPPLEPGEHVRTTDAKSKVHVVRPSWTNLNDLDVTNEIGVSRW